MKRPQRHRRAPMAAFISRVARRVKVTAIPGPPPLDVPGLRGNAAHRREGIPFGVGGEDDLVFGSFPT